MFNNHTKYHKIILNC